MSEIIVKNLRYGTSGVTEEMYDMAREIQKDLYLEEQQFRMEEYESLLENDEVSSYDEYVEDFLGETRGADIDYLEDFEKNEFRPDIKDKIRKTAEAVMQNCLDLPDSLVVTIDSSDFDDKGVPDKGAVMRAARNALGHEVIDYDIAMEASKDDILTQQAYNKMGEMIKTKDYKTFLELRSSIGKYSANNIALIYLQKPDSKAVMGFNAWLNYDRCVDKGQKAISVWLPVKRELKNEKQVDSYLEKNADYYGGIGTDKYDARKQELMKEIEEKGSAEILSSFRLGSVFDVSQTKPQDPEHDNIGEIIALNKPLEEDMANFKEVKDSLEASALLSPIAVSTSLPQQEALYEAVYEYADRVLSDCPEKVSGIKSNTPFKGDMHAIETAMTAELVCAHIGIDSGDKTAFKLSEIFDKSISRDIAEMGRREMFAKCFDRSIKLADSFTKEFDKSFGIDIEAQRAAVKKAHEEKYPKKDYQKKSPKSKKSPSKKKSEIERD